MHMAHGQTTVITHQTNLCKWIRSANRKKITLKWKKIAGACGYKVYISTKSGKGYKKVKTCGKNSKGCTITKCGKKKLSKKKTY